MSTVKVKLSNGNIVMMDETSEEFLDGMKNKKLLVLRTT